MTDIKEMVHQQKDLIINTRRDLHRIPEPAYTEEKTSAYVAEYLNREGLAIQTGMARYGVVGLMETGEPGETLMLRADMDALPITEETGLSFAGRRYVILFGTIKRMLFLSGNSFRRLRSYP